jgi:tetratricopeptide (TPR) repeat protein
MLDSLNYQREVLKTNSGVAMTLGALSDVLFTQGKAEEGLARLEEALALADELGEKKTASEAHKDIADAYSKIGDTAQAFEHLTKHLALDKEIFSEESRKSVEKFNMRVAIADMESQKEVQRLKAERSESILRLKERDLANTASSLAAQTELLGNFRADLRKIVLRPDRYEPEDIIRQVKAKLKELPCEMIDFSKFEGQFATVHPEFRAKLEMTYPELTPQEVKMCMLIHVKLQTAAIARLMCLSERTVEKHRENTRKKLDLKKGEDLAEVLRKLDGKG